MPGVLQTGVHRLRGSRYIVIVDCITLYENKADDIRSLFWEEPRTTWIAGPPLFEAWKLNMLTGVRS